MQNSFSIRYKLAVKNGDETKQIVEGHNLVMRSAIGSFLSPNPPIDKLRIGTGNTNPENRDSGTTTFTNNWADAVSSFTVTASAGFFVSGDVGRILKLDTGEELTITAFSSGTSVTVSAYPTAPAANQLGTVWYDNLTALDAVVSAMDANFGSATKNVVVVTGASGTANATFVKTATTPLSAGGTTIREVGWFTSANGIIGRSVLAAPIALLANDYIQLTVTVNYAVDTNANAISMSGAYGDFSGTSRFYGCASSHFDKLVGNINNGANTSPLMLYMTAQVDLSTIHNNTLSGWTAQSGATVTNPSSPFPSVAIRRFSGGFSGPITIGTLSIGTQIAGSGDFPWMHRLTTPLSLVNLQTMTFAIDIILTRALVN